MIDYEILESVGTTDARWREICTAHMSKDAASLPDNERKRIERDIENRKRIEDELRDRINESVSYGLANSMIYSAADLAWDSAPITKQIYPLMLYAQGKISVEGCAKELDKLKCADKFVKKDKSGLITGIDLPRFYETAVSLVRSLITRRLAAQSNKFQSLYPYYQYEPRSTSLVGKLRADVLSQRMDIMTDQFDYRHHDVQCMRDMFRYAHCLDFLRSKWEREDQWEWETPGDVEVKNDERKKKNKLIKEGVCWINPHPSRTFWDNNYPLASINSDTGCEYVGFWDIVRYKDILDNPSYFNRQTISYGPTLWGIYATYTIYFGQFFCNIKPPCDMGNLGFDLSSPNDRKANIGVYDGEKRNAAVFLTQYFKKLVPKDWGCGEYPFPVWVRFTTASDATVVYVEIMPTTPAAYLGYNEDDNRQLNISFAHEIMPYQDQMTNLVTNMLLTVQRDLLCIIGLNKDVLDDGVRQHAQNQLEGKNYGTTPLVIEYSLSKLERMGINAKDVAAVFETRAGASLTVIFQAMTQLLLLVERIFALSPNEQGQPSPREISATEVNEITNTTSSVYSFISDSIDEFRGAKKRILYESLISCGSREIRVPVKNRYTRKTIEAAGFEYDKDEDEDVAGSDLRGRTIIGTKNRLIYDYIFSSRDGAERPSRVQAANTLVQLLAILQNPVLAQALGKERLFNIVNEIFRMCGAGYDMNLELAEGEPDAVGVDVNEQVQQIISQLAEAAKGNAEAINDLQQRFSQAEPIIAQLAKGLRRNAEDVVDLKESSDRTPRPLLQ